MAQERPETIDWQSACENVKDPRRKQGQRFSILSILLLALAALLSNHVSELAIAEWGAGQSEELLKAFGFQKGVTPHQSTIQRLFRRRNTEELEAAFRRVFLPREKEQGSCAVAIDGKVQKGRWKFEEKNGYPVHAVSIVEHQTGMVLTQGHVEKADVEPKKKLTRGKAPEEKKQKSELTVASRLIQQIDWKGRVLTGDALYCQRGLCGALRQAGGDYLFLVKGNPSPLLDDLHVLFAPLMIIRRTQRTIHRRKRRPQRMALRLPSLLRRWIMPAKGIAQAQRTTHQLRPIGILGG
jgi:predicted transposase YbfD/YdcC